MLAQTQLIDSNDEHSFNADGPPFQFLESYQPKERDSGMTSDCPLRILYLEDEPKDAELVQMSLEAEGIFCELTRAETQADFLRFLQQGRVELILADYALPCFDGISALRIAQETCPEVPFIFVSGCMGEELAIEALKQGATDYVFKTRLSRIAPCVRRALSEVDSVFFRRDLEIAKNVQEASFPQRPPAIPGLNCSTFYKPAHSVGGDYYDFLPLKDGAWGIAIGDVSGKGIGAALVMASLQASLRAQTLHPCSDLEMHVTYLNKLICESCPANFFASLFYAEYEPASRVLRYVNAAHNPPIVVRRNHDRCEVFSLKPGCVPVGAFEDSRFTSSTFELEIGDVLVAYTDGITESENSVGDPFGEQRLERILCDCACRDPQEILQHILDELSTYSAGCSQRDDITLVVMQVHSMQVRRVYRHEAPREDHRRLEANSRLV